ncbi:MAG: hypothetical protein AAF449_18330 [Myxococcota bacterium]
MNSFERHCNVASWSGGWVNLRCYTRAGALADSALSVLAVHRNHPGTSFVWNSLATSSGTPPASYAHASDGLPQFVTRTGVVRYSVQLGPEASPGGHIQVTAYGSNTYCSVQPSGPLAELWRSRIVNVLCARGGVPTDSRFSLLGIKRLAVMGIGPSRTNAPSSQFHLDGDLKYFVMD